MHNLEQSLAKLQKKIGCCLRRMSKAAAGPSENAPWVARGSRNDDCNRGTACWGFLVLKSVTPLKEGEKRATGDTVASEIGAGALSRTVAWLLGSGLME